MKEYGWIIYILLFIVLYGARPTARRRNYKFCAHVGYCCVFLLASVPWDLSAAPTSGASSYEEVSFYAPIKLPIALLYRLARPWETAAREVRQCGK